MLMMIVKIITNENYDLFHLLQKYDVTNVLFSGQLLPVAQWISSFSTKGK